MASEEPASEFIGDVARTMVSRSDTKFGCRVETSGILRVQAALQQCPDILKKIHHQKGMHRTLLVRSGAPVAGGFEIRRDNIASENRRSVEKTDMM